jgi:hypothetical protein
VVAEREEREARARRIAECQHEGIGPYKAGDRIANFRFPRGGPWQGHDADGLGNGTCYSTCRKCGVRYEKRVMGQTPACKML